MSRERSVAAPRQQVEHPRWTSRLRGYVVIVGLAFRADPRALLVLYGSQSIRAVATLAALYGLKLLTDAAVQGSANNAVVAAGTIALCRAIALLAGHTYVTTTARVIEQTTLRLDQRLVRLTGGLPVMEHFERPEYADALRLVRADRRLMGEVANATANGLLVGIELIGSALLLAHLHPALVLLPLFGLGPFLAGRRAHQIQERTRERLAAGERTRRHLFDLVTTAAPAKEVRLFRLEAELATRHHALGLQHNQAYDRGALQSTLLHLIGGIVFAIGYLGAIALVLQRALRGQATAGDAVLAVILAAQVGATIADAALVGNQIVRVLRAAGRYLWLADFAAAMAVPAHQRGAGVNSSPAALPDRLLDGIALQGVSFRYPGTNTLILDTVNLHLPAGAIVALVGDNGAGKTTLVKLLGRYYEPTTGQIFVDGTDLRQFPMDAWRERLSAAFQDFSRFEFLVRETVGVGSVTQMKNMPALQAALARAGADEFLPALPQGLETQLGTQWDGGVDLSGGQWQKLALARAFMRTDPLLVIFDEPTAAIDAETEHALFERFAAAARSGASRGSITLLISHRFSTVRMADLIVVLDGGRIREQGSHDELMRLGGLYAELYCLQAKAYAH